MRRTLAALPCLPTGCGAAGSLAVTDAPGPGVDAPAPDAGSKPAHPGPPECPPMRELRDGEEIEDVNPGVGRASHTILAKRGMPADVRIQRYYTSQSACAAGNFLTVFRVPGGTVFEHWVRRMTAKHGVILHLVDTNYPVRCSSGRARR